MVISWMSAEAAPLNLPSSASLVRACAQPYDSFLSSNSTFAPAAFSSTQYCSSSASRTRIFRATTIDAESPLPNFSSSVNFLDSSISVSECEKWSSQFRSTSISWKRSATPSCFRTKSMLVSGLSMTASRSTGSWSTSFSQTKTLQLWKFCSRCSSASKCSAITFSRPDTALAATSSGSSERMRKSMTTHDPMPTDKPIAANDLPGLSV
mmetsp:Transcript_3559/g.7394  ORF Transcript_3559/g.7394 Transcript_3559/m.7394 type:complete len:209 (+) Transcript_3559:1005-1631(+)